MEWQLEENRQTFDRVVEATNLHKLNNPSPEWPAQRRCDLSLPSPPPFVRTWNYIECIPPLNRNNGSESRLPKSRTIVRDTCVCIVRCKRTVNSCSFLPYPRSTPVQRIVFPWATIPIDFVSLSLSLSLVGTEFEIELPLLPLLCPLRRSTLVAQNSTLTFPSESFVRDWKIRIFESNTNGIRLLEF